MLESQWFLITLNMIKLPDPAKFLVFFQRLAVDCKWRGKKIQRKEFEESYSFFSSSYQFLQVLLYIDVTRIAFSGRLAAPTLGTSGKTCLVHFQPELERSFTGPIQCAVWFPHCIQSYFQYRLILSLYCVLFCIFYE